MGHYSEDSASVRVEFFKPGGKWYMTEALDMRDFFSGRDYIYPADAVKAAIKATGTRGERLLKEFIIVVMDPYHESIYPVCLVPEKEPEPKDTSAATFLTWLESKLDTLPQTGEEYPEQTLERLIDEFKKEHPNANVS